MRYIDLSRLTIAPEKLEALQEAYQEIKDLPPDKRAKAISKHASAWQALKDDLAAYNHGKCWYCEAIQERSDNAVDHFRPKNAVRDCQGHEGYWWLAFDWRNYRYSCTYCNSRRHDSETDQTGGKGDYFPLINENRRCYNPSVNDLELEEPILLDPTKPLDPYLLWFQETGKTVAKYSEDEDPERYKRAMVSIELYNLDHRLREERQILFNDIKRRVQQADRMYKCLRPNDDDKAIEHQFNDILAELLAMTCERAKYSATARAYLKGMRNSAQRPWLDQLLEE